jgi:predicted AAA+ superfamily ATPase
MPGSYVPRKLESESANYLDSFSTVAVLGPRRSGKSTLARAIMNRRKAAIYLDLERPSDLRKLAEPELFFDLHKNELICLCSGV